MASPAEADHEGSMIGRTMAPYRVLEKLGKGGAGVLLALAGIVCLPGALAFAQGAPPRILLDQPLRAVEYQLARLSDNDLIRLERRADDVRYRPVYFALLTRTGLGREIRDEAIAALVAMDRTSPARVLVQALAKVAAGDDVTAGRLTAFLFYQPREALRSDREGFIQAAAESGQPAAVLTAAYGAVMIADDAPEPAWTMASDRGHLTHLLRGLQYLAASDSSSGLQARLFEPVALAARGATDAPARRAALAALGWTRRDAAAFDLLAAEITNAADADARAAAVGSMRLIPASAWPAGRVEPVARALVSFVSDMPAKGRTAPAALDAIDLGERLSGALPAETGRAIRRDLRALGVRVVRIAAVPEELRFDLKWFVVEAAKPVEIALSNPDAMPHNLVVGAPGSLDEIGVLGSAMPMPTDPAVKPFVPNSPFVLQATGLVGFGETARLTFTAPKDPGEYPFVCTFPGHWVRMYGVMLVVADLEAWEAAPTTPLDPMTKRPFLAQR
jgi:azurin